MGWHAGMRGALIRRDAGMGVGEAEAGRHWTAPLLSLVVTGPLATVSLSAVHVTFAGESTSSFSTTVVACAALLTPLAPTGNSV